MKKRFSIFSALLFSALFAGQIFAQGVAQTGSPDSQKTVAPKTGSTVNAEKIERDVAEALTVIQDNYVQGKELNYNDLFKSSIESMLHTLDPHSNYFDAKEAEQFRNDQSSRYFGIGATIGDLPDVDGKRSTYVKATFEGAPAHRAGLRYGDKIVDVNGTSMVGKPFAEVRNFLRGARGTTARITVERYGTGKRETFDIVRDAVPQPSIQEAYMIRPGVGYIGMTGSFTQTTYNEFRQAMQALKAMGMQQLVLDLRDNGGGLVNQAYRVANTFLASGQTIFTQKGRIDGTGNTFKAENSNPETMPVVVMVNRNTASASEILAGALQDHDRALIVGERTFGKGLVQNPFSLEYGSMLLLTIAKYETPSGRLIQRDYSNGNLYDYYANGGYSGDEPGAEQPKGAESKTDTGRVVYGGGGITPDQALKPQTVTTERNRQQVKFLDPIFDFSMQIAYGKMAGFDAYAVNRPINFDYDLKSSDFQVTDQLFQAFKKFAADKYKLSSALADREREYIERNLRTELVTSAYGTTTSYQVFREYDEQLKRAIEMMPQARQLALEGAKANAAKSGAVLDNR